jgi:hypothetical protein
VAGGTPQAYAAPHRIGRSRRQSLVSLTGDDRAAIFGALLWNADKLQSDQGERARALWTAKGKQALEADATTCNKTD